VEVIWPSLMAVLWMGASRFYGMSAVLLGALGLRRMGLFQSFMIITAAVSAFSPLSGRARRERDDSAHAGLLFSFCNAAAVRAGR